MISYSLRRVTAIIAYGKSVARVGGSVRVIMLSRRIQIFAFSGKLHKSVSFCRLLEKRFSRAIASYVDLP